MTKTIKISDDLYANMSIYAKCCIPEKTIDETAEKLLQIGMDAAQVHLGIAQFLKRNPNTD
ncbi:MAG: hypothetical protein ABSB71_10005 [Candidatus Bathyarchaeia archaeon]|jgi:hypothetical protein